MKVLALILFGFGSAAAHGVADGGMSRGWRRPRAPTHVAGTEIDYIVGNTTYQGYFATPKGGCASDRCRAGVLIAHQYMGLGEYEKARADEMAVQGYAAFALDVYGKGVRCNTTACATATMNKALSDIPKLRALISAGSSQLVAHWGSRADDAKLVAMGYCFGGSMVLELARHPSVGASAGLTYAAVSSIHGTLSPYSDEVAAAGEVRTKIQVHHAELDFQGDGALTALEAELKVGVNGTDATWETLKYAKCEHGWTEPGTPIYRAAQAVRAHKSTFEFFEMALGFDDAAADPFPALPLCHH